MLSRPGASRNGLIRFQTQDPCQAPWMRTIGSNRDVIARPEAAEASPRLIVGAPSFVRSRIPGADMILDGDRRILRRVQRRITARLDRLDDILRISGVEERNGIPLAAGCVDHTVQRRAVTIIGPASD